MSAPKGNKFAAREVKRTSRLHLALTPREKAKIVRDAEGRKLSVYVRERLGLDSENDSARPRRAPTRKGHK